MTKWLLSAALMLSAFGFTAIAQTKESLVGTWKLVSAKDTTDTGEVKDAYGQNPTGFLTYTPDGRVMAVIANGGRKPLSVPDKASAPVEERAEAFSTFAAYAGSYSFTGDRVIHHFEVASTQNLVNTDGVRFVKLEGDRLTMRTPPFLTGSVHVAYREFLWLRLKPETTDVKK